MSVLTNISPLNKRAALSLCTATTLFLWVPLYVVHLSINDINFNVTDFFLSASLMAIVASLAFLACTSLLARLHLGWLGSLLLYALLFWAALAGYMLPLVQQAGMVSPADLVTDRHNLALVAGAALLLTVLTLTRLKAATQVFLLILTVTTVGAALPSLLTSSASLSRFTGLSSTDNVLVLSFDGLAGNVARQVLEEDPGLKQQLKDFVFHDNAIAAAPATWASIRSELYGNINFRAFKDGNDVALPIPPDHLNTLQREQFGNADVVTYGAYSAFNEVSTDHITPLTLGSAGFAERAVTALDLYPYIAARVGTALAARVVDRQIKALVPTQSLSPTGRRALEHRGAQWDALNSLHSDDLVTFTDNLHLASDRRSVRYLHLLHTHFPVDLDETCTYRSGDGQWFAANQNYRGVLNETHCALRQTARLIEKLKALGIYDKTLLVVKSDHGAPVSYMDAAPDDFQINDHQMWGYNRYRPLLMLKAPGRESAALEYDHSLASLSDLARTLCPPASGQQACDAVPGMDLLAAPDTHAQGGVFIDVVRDENSGFSPDTHITVEIPRMEDFPAALHNTGKVKLSNERSFFEQRKVDLANVKTALEAYHQAHGTYPPSEKFDGLHSTAGKDSANWIVGLAPDFIDTLPLDPARSGESMPQYLYVSDGTDYKVIAHGQTQSCVYARAQAPELVDPVRNCWGFGYWTPGARNW
ncbi:MAG TPA: hypothetical protein DIT18_07565 [Pseudomonas sp.]|nr:hypothetical protein [Pseudomonas sp.]